MNANTTPHAATYPGVQYARTDVQLASSIGYEYYDVDANGIDFLGSYSPDGSYEVYDNGELYLKFPMAFNEEHTDAYSKTNYSAPGIVSSLQTGTHTIKYSGYGTLQLPNGSFNNVALISSVRTNSLGPNSSHYWWYNVSNGMLLLYFNENAGDTTFVYNTEASTSLSRNAKDAVFTLLGNGTSTIAIQSHNRETAQCIVYDINGRQIERLQLYPQRLTYIFNTAVGSVPGVYILKIQCDNATQIFKLDYR